MQRLTVWLLCSGLLWPFAGQGAEVRVHPEGSELLLQIEADPDTDWRVQASKDLVAWTNLTAFGTLLSDRTHPLARSVGSTTDAHLFYRAVQTDGLFDRTLLRTISLSFTQANWPTLLTFARFTGVNVPCTLSMDNGATNSGVGARYKGNTSFTGAGPKKSINLELDFIDPTARLMGCKTINLNNAYDDETLLREPLYFNTMAQYAVSPIGCLVRLSINESNWGVYSFIEQENNDLIKRFFPSDDGDRWKAPNIALGGSGFTSPRSALSWLGTNVTNYATAYELKTDPTSNSWPRLIHAIDVLNNTPTDELRDRVEEVLAVDRWLWFLAVENVFADDDSYFHKGADYGLYYEPESGRIHPIEHDGNEAFTGLDAQLSPVQGSTGTNRPVLSRLLPIPELRQRYLAHMRTVLEESYHPSVMAPKIDELSALSFQAIEADPIRGFSMADYIQEMDALKRFITNRHDFLTNHAELRPVPPDILAVAGPATAPTATQTTFVTAQVRASGAHGLDSVWLYHRGKSYGRFTAVQMLDDAFHGDGGTGDGILGAAIPPYPAGTKVRFYVEARSADAPKAARFAPARAEQETFSYRVAVTTGTNSPVVINELMASNTSTLADPQGDFDDWIELHNITDQSVDLTGRYLSDEPNNPRKWQFPAGTVVPPNGFLLVWADEDGSAPIGLHASFKLSASGESLSLNDTDANYNAILDTVRWETQTTDRAYGRTADDADVWSILAPTPGRPNP